MPPTLIAMTTDAAGPSPTNGQHTAPNALEFVRRAGGAPRAACLDRAVESKSRQILVVDDDTYVRNLVAKTVTRAGFRADTANDGENGWEAFCRVAYDLVITDHEMPRLTGLRLIARIRSYSQEPPCILISGELPAVESTLMAIVGRGAILAKPFSPAALIEKVQGLLVHGDLVEM